LREWPAHRIAFDQRRLMLAAKIDIELPQWRVALAAYLLDHSPCFRVAHAADRWPVRLDDARFLISNLCQRVAEHLRVVETDARDDRQRGLLADVGRIKAAAQADFDDGNIDLVVHKIKESDRGADFEKGQLALQFGGSHVADAAQPEREIFLADRLLIELDAF